MAPYGPQPKSTTTATSQSNRNITESVLGCQVEAPENGAHGIQVTDEEGEVTTLPGVLGRYQRGAGIVYLLPTPWGEPYHADAVELSRGEAWEKVGEHEAARWAKGSPLRTIWYTVADSWPLTPPSPRITEGRPPLAPTLAPLTEDEDAAREAWADMAHRLTPTGRMVVGLALTSPWIEPAGATASVLSLWGEAGEGKSLLARICAALYGAPDSAGLFGTFNSSGQGLTSHAQDLAHLPIILDEVQSATGDVETQMRALVSGAERKRSNKAGSSVRSSARWGGLVITTSNEPSALEHEMFDRRLLEVQVSDLWEGVPPTSDWNERAAWWRTVADELKTMSGWPWVAMTRQFTPGMESAEGVCDAARTIPMPGTGNLGQLGTLACVGTAWLAEWSGEPLWNTDVWDAAATVIAARAEQQHDPARDAARAIIEDFASQPASYLPNGDRDLRGFVNTEVAQQVCGINHEDPAECEWLSLYSSLIRDITGMPIERLAKTTFKRAMYAPERGRHTHKARAREGLPRTRVITTCLGALEEMAEPVAPAERPAEAPEVPTLAFPEPEPSPFDVQVAAASAGTVTVPVSPAQKPSEDSDKHTPTEEEQIPELRDRLFDWTDSEDVDAVLDDAADAGVTDMVVPHSWPITTATRWAPAGNIPWNAEKGSARIVRDDGAGIRCWAWGNTRASSEEFYTALTTFIETTGHARFTSIPTLGQTIVLQYGSGWDGGKKKRRPMFQVDGRKDPIYKQIKEQWNTEGVATIKQWGDRKRTDVTSYDRNKAYLSSVSQARIAPLFDGENFSHYDADAPVDHKQFAGQYKIVVPDWDSPLPPPHGNHRAGDELWVSAEIMRLYADLDMDVEIVEAWLAPASEAKNVPGIGHLAREVKKWLTEFDDPTRMIPKTMYQSLAGSMRSQHFGEGRQRRTRIYRPDWSAAIEQNSWCNMLRNIYAAYDADPRFVPVYCDVDAVKYPDDLPEPPTFKIGDGLGQYKVEG